ncbi:MAG: hypothetical protein V1808_01620 [Candidatus Daviesbacteria bacterium]
MPNQDNSLEKVLNHKAFVWETEGIITIKDVLLARAKEESREKLTIVNSGLVLSPKSVFDKVRPRAQSWQIADLLQPYEDENLTTLDNLSGFLKSQGSETQSESNIWLVDTLNYETRAALKKQAAAQKEKEQLKRETFTFKISKFKKEPDSKYGDALNRLVCQMADKMEEEGKIPKNGKGKMAEADRATREQAERDLDEQDIEEYLIEKARKQLETRLQNYYKVGLAKLQNEKKAADFAGLMFEIDSRKTNEVWQGRQKRLEDIVIRGLKDETVELVSMFCTINNYDFNGHYTLVPDIYAYQKQNDQQLEPVPLIIDELAQVAKFFQFYGINAPMTIYISDADYIESRQCGPVTESNLQNLQLYLQNLKDYLVLQHFPMKVMFISEATRNNSAYEESKARIWENVSTMKNPNFLKEWSKSFEEDLLKRTESQRKRKFFPESDIERETLEIVKRIWSVNGAQGTFLGTLPENTIMISTERRERDQNYIIDQETRDQFIPVLYILHAADKWTRKVIQNNAG